MMWTGALALVLFAAPLISIEGDAEAKVTAEPLTNAPRAEADEAAEATPEASGIQRWRTPDGKLHFGEKPPAGSTPDGHVGALETFGDTSSLPQVPADDPTEYVRGLRADRESARDERLNDQSRWRHNADCDGSIVIESALSRDSYGVTFIEGTATSRVRYPIANLRICSEGLCTAVGALKNLGSTANFSLSAHSLGGSFRLNARCSRPY